VYSRSNLAYEQNVEHAYRPQHNSNVRIHVSNKKAPARHKNSQFASIIRILVVACLAFTVLYRGVLITDKTTVIAEKQANLQALIASNEKLQVEIDRALDLNNVETIARTELGMRPAEKYQTIYLDLEQVDFVEKTAGSSFSPVGRTADAIIGLFSYGD